MNKDDNEKRHQTSDFRNKYANGVYFDTSVYDLRINFGELERDENDDARLTFHSAITMSWLEAKLAAFYLLANIFNHEREYGAIPIPDVVKPIFLDSDDSARKMEELVGEVAKKFYAAAERLEGESSKKK